MSTIIINHRKIKYISKLNYANAMTYKGIDRYRYVGTNRFIYQIIRLI